MADYVYIVTLRGKVQSVHATPESAKAAEDGLRKRNPELQVQPRMVETTKHIVR